MYHHPFFKFIYENVKQVYHLNFESKKKAFLCERGRYIYVTLYLTHDWYFSLKSITRIKIHVVSISHLKICFSAYFLVNLKAHPPSPPLFKPSFRSTLFILINRLYPLPFFQQNTFVFHTSFIFQRWQGWKRVRKNAS